MKNNFIPVEVYVDNKKSTWYMNVETLTIGELLELRKELIGMSAVMCIDKLLNDQIMNQDVNHNIMKKKFKAEKKKIKSLKRKRNIKNKRRR